MSRIVSEVLANGRQSSALYVEAGNSRRHGHTTESAMVAAPMEMALASCELHPALSMPSGCSSSVAKSQTRAGVGGVGGEGGTGGVAEGCGDEPAAADGMHIAGSTNGGGGEGGGGGGEAGGSGGVLGGDGGALGALTAANCAVAEWPWYSVSACPKPYQYAPFQPSPKLSPIVSTHDDPCCVLTKPLKGLPPLATVPSLQLSDQLTSAMKAPPATLTGELTSTTGDTGGGGDGGSGIGGSGGEGGITGGVGGIGGSDGARVVLHAVGAAE